MITTLLKKDIKGGVGPEMEMFTVCFDTDKLLAGDRLAPSSTREHQMSIVQGPWVCEEGYEYMALYTTLDKGAMWPEEYSRAETEFVKVGRSHFSNKANDWGGTAFDWRKELDQK